MLRITQNSHASGAKSYYSSSDYYVDGQELSGVWKGAAAAKLGLSGEISRTDWDALCDGLNPRTGEKLLQRAKSNRTAGYDFNFHVPKSVSVLYATTKDSRILDAFRASIDATMHDIEAEIKTRVRKDGRNDDRVTGNMVWGEFVHFTSRPVDGIPDPHLHAHCFVFNTTWDDKEHAWKAGQFRDLKRDAPYFEAVFHSRFARRLADLGLPVERTRKGWELAGVPSSIIEKFSRRTALIEETARQKGIDDPHEKAELGAKTRSRKIKDMTLAELQAEWRGRMSGREIDTFARLAKSIGAGARSPVESAAKQAMTYAIGHEFERRSVVPERELLTTALKQAVGSATSEQVHRQAGREDLIVTERNGRRMATTREVLSEERRIIHFARSGRGIMTAIGKVTRTLTRPWLNASQQQAVAYILESHDRVMVVRGAAGVGKTALMQEAVEAIEANGTRVVALAPTADASRGVLRREGFKDAETVARFLMDEALQQKARGQVVWIDEAGLLSAKAMANVFALAEKLDARVLLTGDRRQHGSVERGASLSLLEDEAGIKPAEVKEIKRQAGEYKAAIKAFSEGRVGEGFSRLDRLGWIHEIPEDERYKRLAHDYVAAISEGKTALVVSPTHFEGGLITAEIRRALEERGKLGTERRSFRVLQNANLTGAEQGDALNYRCGDVLIFHQNTKGFKRGDRVEVNGDPLPLDKASRFSVFHPAKLELAAGDIVRITHNGVTADGKHRLNNGALYGIRTFDDYGNIVLGNGWKISKDFGHLAYGYVVTSHASQGKTVDRVFVGQSSASFPASSQQQFYVSCSRGRESVAVYCDDKQALRDAVAESEDRVSATELITGKRQREVVALLARYHDLSIERAMRAREEISYER